MVGKRVRGALYVHRSATGLLPKDLRTRVERATPLANDAKWNVARFDHKGTGLLEYESFDQVAFPALISSVLVDLQLMIATRRDYVNSRNPLILHRKEQLLDPQDPRVPSWTQRTVSLMGMGLFRDNHLIGRRRQWQERLATVGLVEVGDVLQSV